MLILLISILAFTDVGICYNPSTKPPSPFIINIADPIPSLQSSSNSYISSSPDNFVSTTQSSFYSSTPDGLDSSTPFSLISTTYYDDNYLDQQQSLQPSAVKINFGSRSSVKLPLKYSIFGNSALSYSTPQPSSLSINNNNRDNSNINGRPEALPAIKASSDGKSYVESQNQPSSINTNVNRNIQRPSSTTAGLGNNNFVNSQLQSLPPNRYDDSIGNTNSQLQSLAPNSNSDFSNSAFGNSQLQIPNGNSNLGFDINTGLANSQLQSLNVNNIIGFGSNGLINSQFQSSNINTGLGTNTWVNPQIQPGDVNRNSNPQNGNTWINPQTQVSVLSRNDPSRNRNTWVNPQIQPSIINNGATNIGASNIGATNIGAGTGTINFQSQNVNVEFRSRLGSFNYIEPIPEILTDARTGLGSSNYINLLPQRLFVNPNGEYSLDGYSFGPLNKPPIVNVFAPPIVKPEPTNSNKLEIVYQWRYLDWVHPTVQLAGRNFIVGNPLAQDVDVDGKGRVFITSPQWLEGTPITLSVITNLKDQGGPLLTPYPDWTWHKQDCDGLISVYRVAIDECNRLWMVDTGIASGRTLCPMKIVAFDLHTDELLYNYPIPLNQTANGGAQYVNPIVEVGETCSDTYVYVADVIQHGILVYNLRGNSSWRLENTVNNAFGDDPEARVINIAGETITLTDGTLGMSLSPKKFFVDSSKRYLYFNSLASFYQKFADVDSLKRSFQYEPIIYRSKHQRYSQAGVQATSRTGAIFFQLAQFTALACWNIERPFTKNNIVTLAQDETNLQYISGIKVIINAFGEEELWFNTNRLQKTINNSRKNDEINYRTIKGKVNDLIRGTRCESTGYRREEPNLHSWQRI